MNKKERFKIEYFDLLLDDFKKRILGRVHGNYSKSYESYKRINNTERFFLEALAGRDHPAVLDIGCGDDYHVCVFKTIDGMDVQGSQAGRCRNCHDAERNKPHSVAGPTL